MEMPNGIVSQVKKYDVCDSTKCLPKELKYRVQFSRKVSFCTYALTRSIPLRAIVPGEIPLKGFLLNYVNDKVYSHSEFSFNLYRRDRIIDTVQQQ